MLFTVSINSELCLMLALRYISDMICWWRDSLWMVDDEFRSEWPQCC